jgi:hypothetical protein
MTVHQMLCHLNDSYGIALGEKTASPATGVLQRTLLKWIGLRVSAPMGKGVSDPARGGARKGRFGSGRFPSRSRVPGLRRGPVL